MDDRLDPHVLTLIIEVKGSWHPEIRTAMHTQLVDRYLRDNRCQAGLFLVGWFGNIGWDPDDPRRRGVPWASKDEAATELMRQASDLTVKGTREVRAYVLDCALR